MGCILFAIAFGITVKGVWNISFGIAVGILVNRSSFANTFSSKSVRKKKRKNMENSYDTASKINARSSMAELVLESLRTDIFIKNEKEGTEK